MPRSASSHSLVSSSGSLVSLSGSLVSTCGSFVSSSGSLVSSSGSFVYSSGSLVSSSGIFLSSSGSLVSASPPRLSLPRCGAFIADVAATEPTNHSTPALCWEREQKRSLVLSAHTDQSEPRNIDFRANMHPIVHFPLDELLPFQFAHVFIGC